MPHAHLKKKILSLYDELLEQYGWQKWWHKATSFEIIVGAILVQNTNWANVDKSLTILKSLNLLTPEAINKLDLVELIPLIKPSGLYNQKARYLKTFTEWYLSEGGFDKLKRQRTLTLRNKLLALKGIGKETADVILLYVFKRPSFIIDNYTQRLLIQLGLIHKKWDYDELQSIFHEALTLDRVIFSEYHALIVHHGKTKHKKLI